MATLKDVEMGFSHWNLQLAVELTTSISPAKTQLHARLNWVDSIEYKTEAKHSFYNAWQLQKAQLLSVCVPWSNWGQND